MTEEKDFPNSGIVGNNFSCLILYEVVWVTLFSVSCFQTLVNNVPYNKLWIYSFIFI